VFLPEEGILMTRESGTRTTEFGTAAIEHLDALYGYALALTRDRASAEDLVQETYLRAVRAFGTLVPDSNLEAWLFAIMRNAWLNQVRHERTGPQFVGLDQGPGAAPGGRRTFRGSRTTRSPSTRARRPAPGSATRSRASRTRTARSSSSATWRASATSRSRRCSDARSGP
jgi:RNA polymerase sigma factor (sigma-70 family)